MGNSKLNYHRSKNRNRKKSKVERLCSSGLYEKRLCGVKFVFLFVLAMVVFQCFNWQILMSNELQAQALKQWESTTSIQAARGKILDRNGVVLAGNCDSYKITIYPKQISADDYDRVTAELVNILGTDRDKTYKMVSNTYYGTEPGDRRESFLLIRQVEEDKARQVMQLNLSGVGIQSDVGRQYPYNNLLSSVIGVTNIDCVGQTGLELSEDKYLSGSNGTAIKDKTVTGAAIPFGEQAVKESIDGCDISLTIDVKIQSFLENALSEALNVNNALRAEGVILNAKTGEIIAISTKPDYDLNNPPRGGEGEQSLIALSRNRIVADSYEPGSTFKIITLASALDSKVVNVNNYSCTCHGSTEAAGERIKCWKSAGHGTQNLTECAENSCNCAFVDLALKMSTDTFYDYIYKFGFGESTGSGLISDTSGIVTNRLKIRNTDLASIGFGQSIAITPLQLVTAVSAAVNGGNLMQPYIVDTITSADGAVISDTQPVKVRSVISEDTSRTVRGILKSVVENGSGRNAKIAGYSIGGKTGTAQKYEDGKIADGKLIASFIGIAPIDDPEYVCLILVDEPKVSTIFGSTVAAPWVKQVLENTLQYVGAKRETDEETVVVPDVCGMTVAKAVEKLNKIGLNADYQASDIIVNQVPSAGTEVVAGTGVLLYTEKTAEQSNIEKVEVPKLVGMTRYEAYAALKALGLEIEDGNIYNGGLVKSQYPYYGDKVEIGSTVTVKYNN